MNPADFRKSHMMRFSPVLSSNVPLGLFPLSAENWFNDDFQELLQNVFWNDQLIFYDSFFHVVFYSYVDNI